MGRRQVVNVHMLSFAHIMNHEATKPLSMTACAGARECKLPSAPGEVSAEVLSDRSSTLLISTIKELWFEKNQGSFFQKTQCYRAFQKIKSILEPLEPVFWTFIKIKCIIYNNWKYGDSFCCRMTKGNHLPVMLWCFYFASVWARQIVWRGGYFVKEKLLLWLLMWH